jgi:ferrous iron transport protein A
MKPLIEVPSKSKVKIVSISGGRGARRVLTQLGVGIGSTIIIRRNAPFSGPIIIENQGTSIAVGRGVASKIMVEEL